MPRKIFLGSLTLKMESLPERFFKNTECKIQQSRTEIPVGIIDNAKFRFCPSHSWKKDRKDVTCWSWIRLFIEEKECKEETTQNREAINSTCLKKLFPNQLSGYVVGILELSCFAEQKWWNEEEPFLVCFWFMSNLLLRCSPWHGILHANEKK